MNLNKYIKQQNKEKQDRIKNFIYNYQNDTLQDMNDYIYLYEDEAEEILSILSTNKNKIQTANEIILKTGKILPIFSLQFNQYYMYDGNICYKNCEYIYKNFYLKQYNQEIGSKLYHIFFHYFWKQKYYYIQNNIYAPIYFNIQQFKELFYIILTIYKHISQIKQMTFIIPELLMNLYTYFIININCTNKDKRYFLNILTKILIIDIENYYTNPIKTMMIKDKQYINILDLLISNWNLIQIKYKKILKNKSKQWIYFLIKKENLNLKYKNEYLYIINKLNI